MEMDEVFKNLPLAEQKKMLDHLAKLPDVRFLSSEEREKYDESIKAADDYYSGLYGSYIEGEEKGIAKGRAEGRAEGELSKGLTIARNLLAMGMSWSQIMQATGLTEEELKPLQALVYISAAPFRLAPYALKGQKPLAQGIALGIMAISKAPCKGKSFVYCQVF